MSEDTSYPDGAQAYSAVAGEMYIPGELGYKTPAEVLADLDPVYVERAEAHAKSAHKAWPPKPFSDVPMISFSSWD